jgi:hypothetical protein
MKNATEAVDSMAGLSIGGTKLDANGQSLRLLHYKVGQYQKAMDENTPMAFIRLR